MSSVAKRVRRLTAGLIACLSALAPLTASCEASDLPKEVSIRNVEFVLVPEGWFSKSGGVPAGNRDSGGNARVWLDSFYIAKYEARARDLELFMNARNGQSAAPFGVDGIGCALQQDDSGRYFEVAPEKNLPATHVSWVLADEWSRWMGFRLPTEAEWEKAARGTDQRIYPWGDELPDETYANFGTTSECLVWPVDSAMKGRSPYGVYHMTGNVRELIGDAYNPEADKRYRDGVRNPPLLVEGVTSAGKQHSLKLVKGGRWASRGLELMIATRISSAPDDPFQCNGTRFAVDASVVREHLAKGTATVIRP